MLLYILYAVKGELCSLEVLEVATYVLPCMLEAVGSGLYLLEVSEVSEVSEVLEVLNGMRRAMLRMLAAMEGELCSLEVTTVCYSVCWRLWRAGSICWKCWRCRRCWTS